MSDLSDKLSSSVVYTHIDSTEDGDRTLTLKFDLDPSKYKNIKQLPQEQEKFLADMVYKYDKLIDVNKPVHLKSFLNRDSLFETRPVLVYVIRYSQ